MYEKGKVFVETIVTLLSWFDDSLQFVLNSNLIILDNLNFLIQLLIFFDVLI
jgi:hypothetical protein